jgi:ubiquinone biosynthesis protein
MGVEAAPGPAPADTALGAFSEDPPWLVAPEHMAWRRGIDALRARTRHDVPRLVRRRRLPPGVRVVTVGGRLSWALGNWYLKERKLDQSGSRAGLSLRLRQAFEKLGPTYIKLGQILSSGEGIFPDELVSQFKLLRDRVPAEPFTTVRRIVEEDLGRPLEAVFSSFDPTPIAAASIAQVHAATLRPGPGPGAGREVVVKVQRPTVATMVAKDLAAMSWIAPALVGRIPISALANPPALVDLFAETIVEELDFRLEAQNMLDVAHILAATNQRSLVVPRPHPELVTRRVLVMERLVGFSFDDVAGMKAAGIDTSQVVRASLVSFLEGAMLFGVFHGDLHGGNLLPAQIAALRDLGALPADVDIEGVIRDLNLDQPPVDPTQMSAEEITDEIRRVTKALMGYGARMPKELMLFVKDMLFCSNAIQTLAPDVDIISLIGDIALYMAEHHGERISADVGINIDVDAMDLSGIRASFGIVDETTPVTARELNQRRAVIEKRMEAHRRERRSSRRRG